MGLDKQQNNPGSINQCFSKHGHLLSLRMYGNTPREGHGHFPNHHENAIKNRNSRPKTISLNMKLSICAAVIN